MQGEIRVVQAGVYKVSAAFFGKHKPIFQVLVNGSTAMRSGSQMPGMGQYTAARAAVCSSDHQHAIIGCSVTEYLVFPSDACVTVLYQSQPASGQGFLLLQKAC